MNSGSCQPVVRERRESFVILCKARMSTNRAKIAVQWGHFNRERSMAMRYVAITVFLMFGTAAYAQDYATLSTATPGARCPTAAIAIITRSSSVWIQAGEPPTPAIPTRSCICAAGPRPQIGQAGTNASALGLGLIVKVVRVRAHVRTD